MNELPAGLADPLHLPNPHPSYGLFAALAALLLLALLVVLWRRRRRKAPAAAPAAAGPPADTRTVIEKSIEDLRRRFKSSQDYRRGCHSLGQLLRSHFEAKSRHPVTTLTAREMPEKIGGAVASFFNFLAELQFRRREPTRDEFSNACDLAHAVARADLP